MEFMEGILQSQIFFFISSVGFIILGLLLAVLLFYIVRATRTFNNILEQVEKDIDNIGDTTKEMLEDVRESVIFNFLFRKRRRSRRD